MRSREEAQKEWIEVQDLAHHSFPLQSLIHIEGIYQDERGEIVGRLEEVHQDAEGVWYGMTVQGTNLSSLRAWRLAHPGPGKLPVCLLPRHSRRAEAETGRSSIRSQSKADKHNEHGLGKELRGHPKRSFRPSRGRNGSLAGACPQSGGSSSSSSPGGKEGKQEARKFLKQQQPPQKEVEKERPAKSLTFKLGLDRRGSRS